MKNICRSLVLFTIICLTCPGFAWSAKVEVPINPIIVAKNGGDFADPLAAMVSIENASADNPYLVKIMPGVYDLGSTPLVVKDFVSVMGSGNKVTILKGSMSDYSALIQAGSNSALENFSVEMNGFFSLAIEASSVENLTIKDLLIKSERNGIRVMLSNGVSILDSDIILAGQPNLNGTGVEAQQSNFIVKDVNVKSNVHTVGIRSGYLCEAEIDGVDIDIENVSGNVNIGIHNYTSSYSGVAVMRLKNSKIDCGETENCKGVVNNSQVVIDNVEVKATTTGLSIDIPDRTDPHYTNVSQSFIQGGLFSVEVSNSIANNIAQSQLVGGVNSQTFGVNCYNNYDENLAPVVCP